MMKYAATRLGLAYLTAETHETNYRSRKMLSSAGFQESGRAGSELYEGVQTALIQYSKTI